MPTHAPAPAAARSHVSSPDRTVTGTSASAPPSFRTSTATRFPVSPPLIPASTRGDALTIDRSGNPRSAYTQSRKEPPQVLPRRLLEPPLKRLRPRSPLRQPPHPRQRRLHRRIPRHRPQHPQHTHRLVAKEHLAARIHQRLTRHQPSLTRRCGSRPRGSRGRSPRGIRQRERRLQIAQLRQRRRSRPCVRSIATSGRNCATPSSSQTSGELNHAWLSRCVIAKLLAASLRALDQQRALPKRLPGLRQQHRLALPRRPQPLRHRAAPPASPPPPPAPPPPATHRRHRHRPIGRNRCLPRNKQAQRPKPQRRGRPLRRRNRRRRRVIRLATPRRPRIHHRKHGRPTTRRSDRRRSPMATRGAAPEAQTGPTPRPSDELLDDESLDDELPDEVPGGASDELLGRRVRRTARQRIR